MRFVGDASEDRPEYPRIQKRFGENPARFLDSGMDPTPRIRGITDLGLANCYVQVARDLDCRRRVIEACERRRDYLVDVEQRRG